MSWLGLAGPDATSMRRIGSGSYGTVFALRTTPDMMRAFEPIFASRDFLRKVGAVGNIPSSAFVAMKIVLMPRGYDDRGSYMSILREMSTHGFLSRAPPKRLSDRMYDIAAVVPTLYAAGYDRRARAAVFFMEYMHGYGIHDIARSTQQQFPPVILAQIEYALACLFLNGFVHIDFHPGNIFYDAQTGRVKIFDFAFAAAIHPAYVYRFTVYLQTHGSRAIDAFWRDVGEMHGDAAVLARHRAFPRAPSMWHRNVSILNSLERLIADQGALAYYRRMLWIPAQIEYRYFIAYQRRRRAI